MAGKFRPLRADEIDLRIGTMNGKGLSLLLYQDARAAMDILDETVGSLNWTRSHQMIGDRLYCTIEVYDADKAAWISKQDVGTESNTEPEKGQASDSFKRAAVNFGIGRELYTAPFIWISADNCTIKVDNNRFRCSDRFSCDAISYDENGNITALTITNQTRKCVAYQLGTVEEEPKEERFTIPGFTPVDKGEDDLTIKGESVGRLITRCAEDKVHPQKLCSLYGVAEFKDLTSKQFAQICQEWSKVIKKGCAA